MKVGIISLGCPKNLVDTEVMLGQLAAAGHHITPDAREAQAIIVNTCCFIEPARREAAAAVREALALKHRGACRVVIIAGCWPQREGARLARRFPGVDAMVGVNDFHRIAEVLKQVVGQNLAFCPSRDRRRPPRAGEARPPKAGKPLPYAPLLRISPPVRAHGRAPLRYSEDTPRLLATPPWTAYIKIAEGCNHRCAFCVIPHVRGPLHSRTLGSVAAEARKLASAGVKELNLVAQDTTAYGRDLYGKPRICDLLRRLARIKGVRWLRLMYCFPTAVSAELIALLREEPKLCRYIDLPVQHSERKLLRAMGRPGSGADYLELAQRLRAEVPGIAVRTSILVGFPGETAREFEALLDFLATARFDRVGAFVYSREQGTRAAGLPRQVPPRQAQERYRRVMELQQGVSAELNRAWVEREMEVLVEARSPAPFSWVGRSRRDAPEIDGLVYLRGGRAVKPGDFVRARIAAARAYDLEGEIIGRT